MWYSLDIDEVLSKLNTSLNGLAEEEVNKRLKIYGYNEIKIKKENLFLRILKEKLKSAFFWLFFLAFFLSLLTGSFFEGIFILFMIFVYFLFDVLNTYQAENIIKKLKKLLKQEVLVIRNGKEVLIDSKYLVPGDIIILKAGERVPADIRIIECTDLLVDESTLTGESLPVEKSSETLSKELGIHERKNMLYSGTYIIKGKVRGVVVETGNRTYLGSLYSKVYQEKESRTILEEEIDRFSKYISIIVAILIVITFLITVLTRYFSLINAIIFSIAIGIVVIPEGLPTALTIIYTFALDRLKNKGLLVKKQSLVETLGSVDVILTDKTGTLTYNKHTVREFWFNNRIYSVTGKGYEGIKILLNDREVDKKELEVFLEALTNSVETKIIEENNEIKIVGDPLEAALIFLAKSAKREVYYERIKILEFDSARKRMSVVVKKDDKYIAFIKGAPEKILEISKFIYINGKEISVEEYRDKLKGVFEEFAKKGFRTLAFGYKELKSLNEEIEKDIVFLGIVGIEDPIREDAIKAIKFAKDAGIDIYIVTGDHPFTAASVGKKIGLGEKYILGEEIKKMSDKEVLEKLKDIKIIARADPEDKLRLVKLFKDFGYHVAFIGDGINDSLSLKVADIGISLEDAADIAKESAGAILLKNSFSSVIDAIKEGRKIYYSLKVYLIVLLSILLGIFTHILITFFSFSQIFLNVIAILVLNMAVETIYSISIVDPEMGEEYLKKKPERRMITRRTLLGIIRNSIFLGILSTSVAYATVGNVYSIMLFFVLSRPMLMWYYKIKYNINFFKSKKTYLSIILSIVVISVFLNSYLIGYIGGKYPVLFDFVITILLVLLFFIIKIVLLYIERSAGT